MGSKSTTAEFDEAGSVKTDIVTITNEFGIAANSIAISSPFKSKDPPYLRAYWRMDEAIPNNGIADELGNHPSTATSALTSAAGKFAAGAVSASSGGNMTAAQFLSGANLFTFAGWVKFTTLVGDDAILGHWESVGYQILLYHKAGTYLRILVKDSLNNTIGTNTGAPLSAGTWYFVAVTFNKDGNIIIYVDANSYANVDGSPVGNPIVTKPAVGFHLFNSGVTRNIDGILDEWKYYDRELSAAELAVLRNAGNEFAASGTYRTKAITYTGSVSQMTVDLSDAGGTEELTYVRMLVGGVIKAWFDTPTTANGTKTINEGDLTSGSFADVTADFTIEIKLAGDGSATPNVASIGWTQAAGTSILLLTDGRP